MLAHGSAYPHRPRMAIGRKGGGRQNRIARRTAPEAEVNPCPPGQTGGRYRPLSDADVQAIYGTALRILADLGMGDVPPALAEAATAMGATFQNERLFFPQSLVEDVIAQAPRRFTFHGRDPNRSFEVGGDQVYFGTGGAAVQTLDLETGLYRPSTLRDLYDFTRLQDRLQNISWYTRCCVATDVPDNLDLDLNTAYAMLAGTTKPTGMSFFIGDHVDPVVDMFDMALGGEGRFAKTPFCKAHISPIISPLKYGEDAVDVTQAAIRRGLIINSITGAQAGATAPATPAGFLAQTLAETLAALMMVYAFAPGWPMIFGNWPFVLDLRTGAFVGSGGETAVMNAASAQLANWLGLPSGVAACMADAKAVDAQMGAEKAMTALATGLAGGNMIYESAGMMASLLGVSFEAFVLDNEMIANTARAIRGIEVSEETLGFEAIQTAITGEGHFLGGTHTMAAMQRDYFYPALANRDSPQMWAEGGAPDAWAVAGQKARQILAEHHPDYLSAQADRAIRGRFKILLPERAGQTSDHQDDQTLSHAG
ncbi:MAG: trimethylamine methyltransferase family protein [Pseudomonadota bacterium]